jgi:hypothetical protein
MTLVIGWNKKVGLYGTPMFPLVSLKNDKVYFDDVAALMQRI